jgi:hypothetical protein
MQKGRFDGGYTPTEQHIKANLMRQFMAIDGPKGASKEYLDNYERTFGHE